MLKGIFRNPWGRSKQSAYRPGYQTRPAPYRSAYNMGASPRRSQPLHEPVAVSWRGLGMVLSGAIGIFALLGAVAWLVQGDSLRVNQVTVAGAQIVDPRLVADLADVGGRSLLTIDTTAAAKRIEALPEVEAASVRRDWPQGVIVEVTEREGWGYWQSAARRVVIDSNGEVLDRARPPGEQAVTIVESAAGRDLTPGQLVDQDAVALVDRLLSDGTFDRLRVQPVRFEFRPDRGLVVIIDGGPAVVFGDSHNYEFKVAAWGAVLDRIETSAVTANEIDLRFGRQLVVR